MNDDLISELQALAVKYAALKDASVVFAGGEVQVVPAGDMPVDKKSSKCKPEMALPGSIVGHCGKVEIRLSGVHGYGVFAKEPIAKGEFIEEGKLLKLGWKSEYMKDPVLLDYVWGNRCDCDECRQHGNAQYMALGFGSMYNHSENTNTTQCFDFSKETFTVHAKRDIAADEELFLAYGKKYWLIRDFWKGVTQQQLEKNRAKR